MSAQGPGSFAARLRRLREERSLTQEELAERAGLTVKAVGALERGERTRPYPHTVRSLADALALDEPARADLVARLPGRGRPEPDTQPKTLPVPLTPLFGRNAEVEQVASLLASGTTRLVTVTGPGGVGKTRLALAVLAAQPFSGGAVFVELADLRDPDLVLPRVAAAVGVPETAGLTQALAGRPLLLVLDNFEHVMAAAPTVAELVARCAELVVLVTSRAPLRVRAEREVVLEPLALPVDDAPEAVRASPAAQLFVDRTTAAGVPLEVDADNAAAIAALCRRLDGLPLAVELAAGGARMLTPAAMLARLDSAPPVGPRDVGPRQRTVDGAIAWSTDLLEPEELALFGELSVFVGGFSLDAAEAVSAAEVIAPLGALVEQSLVARTSSPDEQPRFRLLEPVRQYAARLLADSGSSDVAARHARYFAGRAVAAGPVLHSGRELARELDRLEADHGNLRAAYDWLLHADRVADAAELAGNLWLFLALRGHAREGLAWLERLGGGVPDAARCRALTGRLGLLFVTGDIAAMRAEQGAVALARGIGDAALASETLSLSAHAAVFAGDVAGAAPLVDEALALAERAGSAWARAHALLASGQLALVGGRYDDADRILADAVDAARTLGNQFTLAATLNTLANLTAARGEHERTAALLDESVAVSVEARLSWTLSYAIPALAGVAVRLGESATAARLFGAAATLSATHAVDPRFPLSREQADQDLVAAREELGEAAFGRAWDAGRTTSPEEVAALAAELTRRVRG